MNLRADWPARVLAVATVTYSMAMTVRPAVLAKPCGLTSADGTVPAGTTALIRSIGVRDVALAAALALAPGGYPVRLLTVARAISDAADAVWLGRIISDKSMQRKVAGVAVGWALLESLAGLTGAGAQR